MAPEVIHKQVQFWFNWTLLSLGTISLSYLISLIVVLLIHGSFGFNMKEWGSYLSQTIMQMAGGATIGLGTGLFQRAMLRKIFPISSFWIYALVSGFAVTELIAGIVLWQLNLNRGQLRFIEFNPLPEALIFAVAGLIVGLFQWTILRRHYSNSGYWVLASALGWGTCILVTIVSIWAFFIGTLLYGVITASALLWILQSKQAAIYTDSLTLSETISIKILPLYFNLPAFC